MANAAYSTKSRATLYIRIFAAVVRIKKTKLLYSRSFGRDLLRNASCYMTGFFLGKSSDFSWS